MSVPTPTQGGIMLNPLICTIVLVVLIAVALILTVKHALIALIGVTAGYCFYMMIQPDQRTALREAVKIKFKRILALFGK
jgi:hypothetical protein